ncbi:FtsH protease activity modulator HflK [Lacrimispora sp.]|uniref:FtsH protease activity modulator HflK n=1 Tax=Lacrimispora sp. TaxID=2719234 RepID=UPI0028A24E75|nr:FtsH protease activity modulator HflK [Lacrimispora sp.]
MKDKFKNTSPENRGEQDIYETFPVEHEPDCKPKRRGFRLKLSTCKDRWKAFRRMMKKSKGNQQSALEDIKRAFGHINPQKAKSVLIIGVIAIYLLTGIYVVNPGEQAVIRRFGAVVPMPVTEGIHYRLPSPVDQVQKVNVSEIRRADIGMSLPEHMHQEDSPQAIQLLTGDENIITSQAIVHYKVKDASAFLYNVNSNDEQLVRRSVESALVELMSNMEVDDILSTEKVTAQNFVIRKVQETLDGYNSGIQVTAFNIQTINPPEAVSAAFLDVNAAKEDKEKEINQAKGYYNGLLPEARGKAEAQISQAEAYKIEVVNEAAGDTDKFNSMLAEYQKNSQIYTQDTTKYRLLLETFEKILPKVKKYIVNSTDGSVDVKLLGQGILAGSEQVDDGIE